jgi:hypothetical protein
MKMNTERDAAMIIRGMIKASGRAVIDLDTLCYIFNVTERDVPESCVNLFQWGLQDFCSRYQLEAIAGDSGLRDHVVFTHRMPIRLLEESAAKKVVEGIG